MLLSDNKYCKGEGRGGEGRHQAGGGIDIRLNGAIKYIEQFHPLIIMKCVC